jgi:hypothetical protein
MAGEGVRLGPGVIVGKASAELVAVGDGRRPSEGDTATAPVAPRPAGRVALIPVVAPAPAGVLAAVGVADGRAVDLAGEGFGEGVAVRATTTVRLWVGVGTPGVLVAMAMVNARCWPAVADSGIASSAFRTMGGVPADRVPSRQVAVLRADGQLVNKGVSPLLPGVNQAATPAADGVGAGAGEAESAAGFVAAAAGPVGLGAGVAGSASQIWTV